MNVRSMACALASLAAALPFIALPVHAAVAVSPWTTQTSGLATTNLEGVSFPDCLNGWAVGDIPTNTEPAAFNKAEGAILHTTDGGQTWTPAQTNKAPIALESVFFIDAMHGWIGTDSDDNNDGFILYTSDGGTTWTSVKATGVFEIDALSFVDTQHGFAGTGSGNVLATSNGGVTWTSIFQTPPKGQANSHSDVEGLAAFDATHAWAATSAGGGTASVYGSTNGTSFAAQPTSGTTKEAEGVAFTSTTEGWVTGEGNLLIHTTDGGTTWNAQTPPNTLASSDFESVAFPDATHGWFVSDKGDIVSTATGGTTWNQEVSPTVNGLFQVVFHTLARGWAVGNNGTILNHLGPPTVAKVTPASGPVAGGTQVTISGCGFTGATGVKFGSSAGANVVVVNDGTITVTAPSHFAGPTDVTVTTPGGTSQVLAADVFTFVAPAPTPSPSPTPALPKAGGAVTAGGAPLEALAWILLAAFALVSAAVVRRVRIRV